MSISYGWEKLHLAVHSLCGQGDQSERLINAIVYNLVRIKPENDIPEEMQSDFNNFMKEMSFVNPAEGEGSIQATVNSMDEIGRKRAVEKIISLYDNICRHREVN